MYITSEAQKWHWNIISCQVVSGYFCLYLLFVVSWVVTVVILFVMFKNLETNYVKNHQYIFTVFHTKQLNSNAKFQWIHIAWGSYKLKGGLYEDKLNCFPNKNLLPFSFMCNTRIWKTNNDSVVRNQVLMKNTWVQLDYIWCLKKYGSDKF